MSTTRRLTDPSNRMTLLDVQTGSIVRAGENGISRSGTKPDRNNFAPRLGFALSADPATVIRGGYGLYYESGLLVANTALYFNPPFFNIRVYFPTATSLLTLDNPFPSTGGITPPASLSTLSPDVTTGYQHWNLNVQHGVGSGTVSLAYAGSKGTHLIRSRDLNQPPPGPGDVQTRRPDSRYGNIFFIESGGNSHFHSLQASYSSRLRPGLSLLASYMWSKSIDDTSAFLGTRADKNFPQDSRNYAAERAVSSFDVTHRGTATIVWSLPGAWLRGFQASAIASMNTGQPFTPILRFDNSNTGNTGGQFGSDRPDVTGDPNVPNPAPEMWFNTSAFAVPRRYTFGSAGRNILRGPSFATIDVALSRSFQTRKHGCRIRDSGV